MCCQGCVVQWARLLRSSLEQPGAPEPVGSPATEKQNLLRAQLLCRRLGAPCPASLCPSQLPAATQAEDYRVLPRRSPQRGRQGCTRQQSQALVPMRRQQWAWPGCLCKVQRLRRSMQTGGTVIRHRRLTTVIRRRSLSTVVWRRRRGTVSCRQERHVGDMLLEGTCSQELCWKA